MSSLPLSDGLLWVCIDCGTAESSRQREVNGVSTEAVKRHTNLMSMIPYKMSRWEN